MTAAPTSALDHALLYLALGLVLTPLRPKSKHTMHDPPELVDEPARARDIWGDGLPGVGVVHGPSSTLALDIDSAPAARLALDALGASLDGFLDAGARWESGRPHSSKCLFRVPRGTSVTTKKLFWPPHAEHSRRTVFELRGGDDWDVMPPSVYLNTGQRYRWSLSEPSSWRDIPPAPDELLDLVGLWPVAKTIMAHACPWGVGWSAP